MSDATLAPSRIKPAPDHGGTAVVAPMAQAILTSSHPDISIRWQPGLRFEHLFERRVDALGASGQDEHLAVDGAEGQWTYGQLDREANQLARYLLRSGFGPGDRLGLLFDKTVRSYITTLAVLKIRAAYVPLDISFPADRIAFISEDAEVRAILSLSCHREQLDATGVRAIYLDTALAEIATESPARLNAGEFEAASDGLAYIIYTSGSTGRPKGVPIEHRSICNFIGVAAEVYGLTATDRMYQGLTIAFDFAVEEIWVPLAVGATLVPGPSGATLVGSDLGEFIRENRITALCCVPTLLATLDADLPELRYIMVSGEACPQDLVERWHRPGRRFLNAYGPTEATVTATITELVPGRPVTIGAPLPTYSIVILDPAGPEALPFGATGEIAIAGVGISKGYLNRDDLTKKAFIPDFLGIEGNESGLIYRTGDLGRINGAGEVEYLGRIDTQVKIRGYRIELTEIESVIMQHPGVAQAVVNKHEVAPGSIELAAYFTLHPHATSFSLDELVAELRTRLPAYMVPVFFEELEAIPLLPSHKADRKSLPKPTRGRYASASTSFEAPASDLELEVAAVLAGALRLPEVSVTSHFFDDLGANSLLMAQFCTRLREALGVSDISMRDTYMHPTVRRLAAHVATLSAEPARPTDEADAAVPLFRPASTLQYVLCGAAQVGTFVAYLAAITAILISGVEWIAEASAPLEVWGRSVLFGSGYALLLIIVPIALKWLLVGRWTAGQIPVWSWAYYRFWVVKQLVRLNPLALSTGTALYNVYLRLLGARIGRNVTIFSASVPICTDLISIGDDTVIRKDCLFNAYRARSGVIETGTVSIGARAFVGEFTVLDIDTSMGDDTQLGHTSSLQRGQRVPSGTHYHGSPAVETQSDYDRTPALPASTVRRVVFPIVQLLVVFGLGLPGAPVLLSLFVPELYLALGGHLHQTAPLVLGPADVIVPLVLWSMAGYFGSLVLGLAAMLALPRLANLALRPGATYPLFGVHFWLLGLIGALTNSVGFNRLFGDSSYVIGFLKGVGYDLSGHVQTGSNFGAAQKHDTPFLTRVSGDTLVSDGLSISNAEISATSFRLVPAVIGTGNFLGNNILYPAGGRTGDNCLLATKVMIPIDGPVRENVGLLGSPSFEIPRTVKRDKQFDYLRSGPEFEDRLARKNASNLVTIGLFLLTRWFLALMVLGAFVAAFLSHGVLGPWGYVLSTLGSLALSILAFILIERLTLGFRKLEPQSCSIYDPYYWFHERHWKLCDSGFRAIFNGTPLKGWVWRLLGVGVGRQLFDDGASMSERSLVSIGDFCTLNDLSMIEGHSMEDRTFKSDRIRIGNFCTVGANAFINYGVVMNDHSTLQPDAFLMKGETVLSGTTWGANPARQLRS